MKHLGKAVKIVLAARPVVWSLVVVLLLLGVAPSWGEEGTGTPQAIGYITSDGETGLLEFVAAEPLQGEVFAATVLGIPAEPPAHQLVRLTNAERANHGLPPLKAASELMNSSQYHSDWMASHNCFDHDCPSEPYWVTRIESAAYLNWVLLGENIAKGYPSANGAVQAWMNSTKGHRENMLNPGFREAGGGYAYSSTSYWTMDYGARSGVYPVVINGEAWSTTSRQVQLYVYGQGWAEEMQFRNEGGAWSGWQAYSSNKGWTLSSSSGSTAVVYAQIRQGGTVLESSDAIYLDLPLTVVPTTMVFLLPPGASGTTPAQYAMSIDAVEGWTATANQTWIKLSQGAGSGPATVIVYLEGFPTGEGTHSGTITVESLQMEIEVQVRLVVTDEPLQKGYVPLVARS
jgi:hypothetical protein